MNELNAFISTRLLNYKAVKYQPKNPFTWGTGWVSPIYFDSRKLLSYPQVRCLFKLELSRLTVEKFPDVEVIAAVAPNSIALGILVAEELGLPFVYVHPRPKDHGLENMIEGDLKPHQKVVIIEDQISLGANCTKVQETLQRDGSRVLGLVSIFNFNLKEGNQRLKDNHLEAYSLTTLDAVLEKVKTDNLASEADIQSLLKWQENPSKWKK